MTKYRAVSVVLMSILIAAVIVLCALSQSIQNKRAAAKTVADTIERLAK